MASPDLPAPPFEIRLDPNGPAGNFIPPLARLLLSLARRRLAARQSPGKEGPEEREKSDA
jgi:hypothetical protein